tara:strand:+ start:275 stop:583 length:309 start_codon:yes stop_codon:yes gene_type:complete
MEEYELGVTPTGKEFLPQLDFYYSFSILATSESEARSIAQENGMDETNRYSSDGEIPFWTDPVKTFCKRRRRRVRPPVDNSKGKVLSSSAFSYEDYYGIGVE